VAVKSGRRRFTAESRLRILEEAERRMKPGEVGQLLRREGLYRSHLASWRKARHDGALRGLTLKTRGAKPKAINPLEPKVRELESKVARLEKELHKAHTILDVQEEVAGLLGDSTSRAERTRERGLRIGAED
jgi:transposase-like protein